ncbi:MAG: hypothetical protein ABIQ70_08395 [Dokdonella sp.]
MKTARLMAAGVLVCMGSASSHASRPLTIPGPEGSGSFGRRVEVLPNGNVVVVDSDFDSPAGVPDVGAVYLFKPNGALISLLMGSSAGDHVGSEGITILRSGHYVVRSPYWDGSKADVGAVTFCNDETGTAGVVSAQNSLTGASESGFVSSVVPLANGNYVVSSPFWDSATAANAGAVTFGDGQIGVTGIIGSGNSLVGSTAGDRVGDAVTALPNGNYVVRSSHWNNGAIANVGAVTFGDGTSGVTGVVGSANSMIGSALDDQAGSYGVSVLANGNYVISSPLWDNGAIKDAGASTLGNGLVGTSGIVGAGNSWVGSTTSDQVGSVGIEPLTNGNYVVRSPLWNRGSIQYAGAATLADGASFTGGEVGIDNSLVGSTRGDQVGGNGVSSLTNGNYVVSSGSWTNGAATGVGAVTFGNGASGVHGIVGPGNSLVGSTKYDSVGFVRALPNGNYVVFSPLWHNGLIAYAGAATLGNGQNGTSGFITSANSLVGSSTDDRVGSSVTVLANGNFVVHSPQWDNGSTVDAGAVTFFSANSGPTGPISSLNSLVGTSPQDSVGSHGIGTLYNGDYVVQAPHWSNVSTRYVGAITIGNGETGTVGTLTPFNSLVGSTFDDRVGSGAFLALPDGGFVVGHRYWNRGGLGSQGAATYIPAGTTTLAGTVNAENSVLGNEPGDQVGSSLKYIANNAYAIVIPSKDVLSGSALVQDVGAVCIGSTHGEITAENAAFGKAALGGARMVFATNGVIAVVGRPADNEISIFNASADSDEIFANGFEAD